MPSAPTRPLPDIFRETSNIQLRWENFSLHHTHPLRSWSDGHTRTCSSVARESTWYYNVCSYIHHMTSTNTPPPCSQKCISPLSLATYGGLKLCWNSNRWCNPSSDGRIANTPLIMAAIKNNKNKCLCPDIIPLPLYIVHVRTYGLSIYDHAPTHVDTYVEWVRVCLKAGIH